MAQPECGHVQGRGGWYGGDGVMGRLGGQVEGVDTLLSSKKPLKEQPGLIRFVTSEMWVVDYSGAQWEVGRQVGGIWTEQVKGDEGARA